MCTAPSPCTEPCRRGSQLCREGQGWGTPANTNDTCFILYATFFVGAPVKNTHGQPSLSQKERGPRKGGFWLLALSRVGNKAKALSLLEKTNCAWAFYVKAQETVWIPTERPEEPTWVSRQWWKESIGIWPGPLTAPVIPLQCGTRESTTWLSCYFLI